MVQELVDGRNKQNKNGKCGGMYWGELFVNVAT